MAKITGEKAEELEAAAAEGGEFGVIPAGIYHGRLSSVDATRSGNAGPYWTWEYDLLDDDYQNRKLWNNTSLSAKAAWKFKETFDAFGVPIETDTDDLCGRIVKLVVSTRVIQEGQRKGQEANQIDTVLPADEEFAAKAPEAASSGAASGREDIF